VVPDERAVEQFAAACLDPPFDDRVHAGHSNAAEHHCDAGVGEDRVDQCRVFAVAVADKESGSAAGILEVHGEVAHGLRDPGGGRVGRGAQDSYAAAGVLNDCQDVHRLAGQRHGFEEVGREDGLGLGSQERRPRDRASAPKGRSAGAVHIRALARRRRKRSDDGAPRPRRSAIQAPTRSPGRRPNPPRRVDTPGRGPQPGYVARLCPARRGPPCTCTAAHTPACPATTCVTPQTPVR
jgi:hypothetical protein